MTDCHSAVLVVYRQLETNALVALKVEVWQGATPEAEIPLLDCQGLLPSQIHGYLQQVLTLLNSHYGIRWLARQVECSSELYRPKAAKLSRLEQAEPAAEAEATAQGSIDLAPLWQALEEQLQNLWVLSSHDRLQHHHPCQ